MMTMFAGAGCRRQARAERQWRRLVALCLALVLAVAAPGPAFAQSAVSPTNRVVRSVVVRAGPGRASEAVGALKPGDRAILIGDLPGWFEIRLPNGVRGFVSKSWTSVGAPVTAALLTGPTRLHVIDVGTGLALFIDGPGFTMLFDAGSMDDKAKGPDNRVTAYLRAFRPDLSTIDHLVLSHPHQDHQELMPDIFDRYQVRNVWDSGRVQQTGGYCRFLKKVEAEPGVIYHAALPDGMPHVVDFEAGSCTGKVTLAAVEAMTDQPVALAPGIQFTVLNRDSSPHSDPNGNSIVIRLDVGARKILLVGDAEGGERKALGALPQANSIEGRLLEHPADIHADVLVAGHHGSLTSSRLIFLNAVGASVYIISAGPYPYSGVVLPDPEIRKELDRRGDLFSTDVQDDECRTALAKVGKDHDGRPGGCSNILVTIDPNQQLSAAYSAAHD